MASLADFSMAGEGVGSMQSTPVEVYESAFGDIRFLVVQSPSERSGR